MPIFRVCPHCGSNLDPDEACDCMNAQQSADKPRMVTREDWAKAGSFTKAAIPGDFVEECIVDELRDILPPTSLRAGYLQVGEPYSHELDAASNRWRPTYMTFRREGADWKYCGCCFQDGTTQPEALTIRMKRESDGRRT